MSDEPLPPDPFPGLPSDLGQVHNPGDVIPAIAKMFRYRWDKCQTDAERLAYLDGIATLLVPMFSTNVGGTILAVVVQRSGVDKAQASALLTKAIETHIAGLGDVA